MRRILFICAVFFCGCQDYHQHNQDGFQSATHSFIRVMDTCIKYDTLSNPDKARLYYDSAMYFSGMMEGYLNSKP